MPGYIIHLTEAALICRTLQKSSQNLSDEWINLFQLGCLLPDTKRKAAKQTSHFWNPAHLNRQAIAPDLNIFYQKYGRHFSDPLMLGYRTHLKLDAFYVNQFWDTVLEFHDFKGADAVLSREIKTVYLKHFHKEIPVEQFFSEEYYYGDYTRMNGYFLNKYRLTLPVYEKNISCPVQEVNTEDLKEILYELKYLASHSGNSIPDTLRVFSLKDLEHFIHHAADLETDEICRDITGS